MLSEERIMELAEISPIWYAIPQGREKYLLTGFARRIEREVLKEVKVQIPTATMEQEFAWHQRQGFIRGYKQGQKRMREMVLNGNCSLCHDYVRNLEIEEPK